MTCPYCGQGRHPCPAWVFPRHRAHCGGWIHGNGAHSCGLPSPTTQKGTL